MNGLFRALDDPTRRRILDLLGQRDLSAGEIAAEFSPSGFSYRARCNSVC